MNWAGFEAPYQRRRVALPTYPFERQRYWVESKPAQAVAALAGKRSGHPLLGERFEVAGESETFVWQNAISTKTLPYLADHRIQGRPVLPATAYIEMAAAAAKETFPGPVTLRRFVLLSLFFVSEIATQVQVIVSRLSQTGGLFRIYGRSDDSEAAWGSLCIRSN